MRLAVLFAAALVAGVTIASARDISVRVPDVRGQNLRQAYARIHATGLRVTTTRSFGLVSMGLPQVVRQSPSAGAPVEAGSAVVLTAYQPPTVAPIASTRAIQVPPLTGVHLSVALARLKRAHLTYWVVNELPALRASSRRSFYDAYRVTGQLPKAGVVLTQRREVDGVERVTPVSLSVSLLTRRR